MTPPPSYLKPLIHMQMTLSGVDAPPPPPTPSDSSSINGSSSPCVPSAPLTASNGSPDYPASS